MEDPVEEALRYNREESHRRKQMDDAIPSTPSRLPVIIGLLVALVLFFFFEWLFP